MNKSKPTMKISHRAVNELMRTNTNAFNLYLYLRYIEKTRLLE